MTPGTPLESPVAAYGRALALAAATDPSFAVLDVDAPDRSSLGEFQRRWASRYERLAHTGAAAVRSAAERCPPAGSVFVSGPVESVVAASYASIRQDVCGPRLRVRIVATASGLDDRGPAAPLPFLEDIGLVRALPGVAVAVPADGPSAEAATRAALAADGPVYLRLAREAGPVVSDGTFRFGHAPALRDGSDLTVVAVGGMVPPALRLAEELRGVGVACRVLDFASVKPFDEPTLLRAARDTGAILVAEEHSVVNGVGSLVASATAENYPVPVRRLGIPDIQTEPGDPRSLRDRYGLSADRLRDEAWELLRVRGKVE